MHRSSIYRRWRTLVGIIADLSHEISSGFRQPETSSLHDDLVEVTQQLTGPLDADGAALVRALGAWPDLEVQEILRDFWTARRSDMAQLLHRHDSSADPAAVLRQLAASFNQQATIERSPISPNAIRDAATAATHCAMSRGSRNTMERLAAAQMLSVLNRRIEWCWLDLLAKARDSSR